MNTSAATTRSIGLSLEEGVFETAPTRKFEQRKPFAPRDNRMVTAFLPGIIQDLRIKEGQSVKQGEPMLVVEAMKMENILFAQRDGVVKKIHVKQGEMVPKGRLLLEFE